MSLFDALNTAVSGLNAQSTALGNISDNVANSQTVGFKSTSTSFEDYLTQSNASVHTPGAVVASPQYNNTLQGSIEQVSDPTSIAITGGGFFAVQQPTGPSTFNPEQFYTRAGDFAPNSAGYLVNSTGYALDGWPVTNGVVNNAVVQPIQISKAPSAPIATANINVAANLPTTPPQGTTSFSSTVEVNDSTGTEHSIALNWSQVPTTAGQPISTTNPAVPNEWSLSFTTPGSTAGTTGPLLVTFGDGSAAAAGTITSIVDTSAAAGSNGAAPQYQSAGKSATVALGLNYGSGTQAVNLNLGQFGSAAGVTQFSGSTYDVTSLSQDGATQGNYSSVTINPTGSVVINYDNGATKTIAQIPLASFNSADALQQQNGQAFTSTVGSGAATLVNAGTAGTGTLTVSAEEGSNVDISAEFTQMIVAQRAYTANTKIVTIADQLLQDTLNMVTG